MWFAELTAGDSIKIGDVIVTLEEKTGKRARLSIGGDKDVAVTVISANHQKEDTEHSDAKPLEQVT
jgi:hypothetical protein